MKEVLVSTKCSGYPFHLMNEELGLSLTDHEKKKNPEEGFCWWKWWATLKPFVNGGATAFVGVGSRQTPFAALYFFSAPVARLLGYEAHAADFVRLQNMDHYKSIIKLMPAVLFAETIRSTARLGSFEIIRRKAIAFNDGRPLTLIQEASCGLTAGVIGSCIVAPFDLAYMLMRLDATKPAAQRANLRNTFCGLYRVAVSRGGVSTLGRVGGPIIKRSMVFDMGMLASYYPSLNYLKESRGFSEWRAQMGASAISAVFATAGILSHYFIEELTQNIKYPYTSSLSSAFKTLIFDGPRLLVIGTPLLFYQLGPRVMATWIILEEIRKLELSIGL